MHDIDEELAQIDHELSLIRRRNEIMRVKKERDKERNKEQDQEKEPEKTQETKKDERRRKWI